MGPTTWMPWILVGGSSTARALMTGLAGLRDFDLRGARFDGAVLTNVELQGVDLTGASFQGATLYFVDLRETKLERVNLSDAMITRSYLDGAVWSETVCPSGVVSSDNFGTCRGQLSGAPTD